MKIRRGPRPWSIHLFALAFGAVAIIGLYLAVNHPFVEWFKWSRRLPWMSLSEEGALIAAFSVFTMALFPLVWIYAFGAKRTRWIVVGFGFVKIALWWQAMSVTTIVGLSHALRLTEPLLILAAIGLLLTPSSLRWLSEDREVDIAKFQ